MTPLGKSLVAGIIIIIGAIVAFYFYATNNVVQAPVIESPGFTPSTSTPQTPTTTLGPDPANTTYLLDSTSYFLTNGVVVLSVASSSAKDTVKIFTTTTGDITADGKADAAVILTQNSGGSGTFYYVSAALNVGGRYQGTKAILLGDRIAPQTLEIKNGQITANYAERHPGEPMTTQPSVGVSKHFIISGNQLLEIVIDP